MDNNYSQQNEYSNQQTQSVLNNQPVGSYSKRRPNLKKLIIAGVILLVVIVGIVIYAVFNSQNSAERIAQERHAAPDPLMAKVGDVEIYENDVVIAAQEQYNADAVTPEVMNTFLNLLIERAILDIEAEKLGITVSENEILVASGNSTEEVVRKQHRYSILEEKIMAAQVESIQAYMIGFWVRPVNDPHQMPIYAEQRRDGLLALTEAEARLRANEVPYDIAKSLYDKYPSLQPIWALNGYLMNSTEEEHLYTQPRIYTFDEDELAALKDDEVYNAMRTMNVDDVKRVMRSFGSGGVVMKVVDKTNGEFSDYNEFMTARKKELISVYREV